ncbi:MAG: hypothetical protein RLY49_342 [Candidatus Parcubacteria bacterium]|jgi:hypothetical protein
MNTNYLIIGLAFLLITTLITLTAFRRFRIRTAITLLRRFEKFESPEFYNFDFSPEAQHILFCTHLSLDRMMKWLQKKMETQFFYEYVDQGCDSQNLTGRFSVIIGGRTIPFELVMSHKPENTEFICVLRPR